MCIYKLIREQQQLPSLMNNSSSSKSSADALSCGDIMTTTSAYCTFQYQSIFGFFSLFGCYFYLLVCASLGYCRNTITLKYCMLFIGLQFMIIRLLKTGGVAMGRALDLRSTGRGFKSYSEQKLRNNFWQFVHTYMYVPLSPSSMTWYRPRGGDALRLER